MIGFFFVILTIICLIGSMFLGIKFQMSREGGMNVLDFILCVFIGFGLPVIIGVLILPLR